MNIVVIRLIINNIVIIRYLDINYKLTMTNV